MNKTFLMYARYMQDKDLKIYNMLSSLPNAEREMDKGSYYKSLSGIFVHSVKVAGFFLDLFRRALSPESAARKLLPAEPAPIPEGELSEEMWKNLGGLMKEQDQTFVDFVSALIDTEMDAAVAPPWLQGKTVPLYFMMHSYIVHQIHHHGQISQILDEMKIPNDFSAISMEFMPK